MCSVCVRVCVCVCVHNVTKHAPNSKPPVKKATTHFLRRPSNAARSNERLIRDGIWQHRVFKQALCNLQLPGLACRTDGCVKHDSVGREAQRLCSLQHAHCFLPFARTLVGQHQRPAHHLRVSYSYLGIQEIVAIWMRVLDPEQAAE